MSSIQIYYQGPSPAKQLADRKATMKTWCDYAPEELNYQYDNRSAVSCHQEIFRDWKRRSRLAHERPGVKRNLAYGHHPRQILDLFVPTNLAGPAPLHIYLHGGYWQALSKEFSGFVADGLVKAGIAVAVVNYRLCPEVSIEEILDDIKGALVWLHRNGAAHGVNPKRVQLSGHSTGGHLVAMLWTTDWTRQIPELPTDFLHSGIGISGLYDLESLVLTPINRALELDIPRAKALSPTLQKPGCRAPLLLAVGETESDEYHRQSEHLHERWKAAGVPMELERLKGHHHFSIVDELACSDGALCRAALALWSR